MLYQKIPDSYGDQLGKLLEKFAEISTWSQEKHHLFASILKLSETENYYSFSADGNLIGLTALGTSCLLDIPQNQKGNLKIFKGERVRVICISKNRYSRYNYAAKVFTKDR